MAINKAGRQAQRRRQRNRSVVTITRSTMLHALNTLQTAEPTESVVLQAIKSLDRAAQKRVIHPNTAARKKSRLKRKQNRLTKSLPVQVPASK